MSRKSSTGLDDPLLRQLLQQVCREVGVEVETLPPLYVQLSLAALQQAETYVLTYVCSHLRNAKHRRKNNKKGAAREQL